MPPPKGAPQLVATAGPEFERAAKALTAAGKGTVRNAMGRRTKSALNDAAKAAKDAVRATRSEHGSDGSDAAKRRGGRGLRDAIADAIYVTSRTTGDKVEARVAVDTRKLPDGQKSLPGLLDGQGRRWRKPVFGNREVWRPQPSDPWWTPTIKQFEADMRRAAEEALDEVAKDIRRAI